MTFPLLGTLLTLIRASLRVVIKTKQRSASAAIDEASLFRAHRCADCASNFPDVRVSQPNGLWATRTAVIAFAQSIVNTLPLAWREILRRDWRSSSTNRTRPRVSLTEPACRLYPPSNTSLSYTRNTEKPGLDALGVQTD